MHFIYDFFIKKGYKDKLNIIKEFDIEYDIK